MLAYSTIEEALWLKDSLSGIEDTIVHIPVVNLVLQSGDLGDL